MWYEEYRHLLNHLARIEGKLDALLKQEGKFDMATQATLDKLTADVAANTSAAQAASLALTGFVKTVSDLTAQLQDAIAGGDDAAIQAAAAALEANNATLAAATPAVAAAVAANT